MSVKSFAQLQEEDRRLVIVRVLHDSTDYTCNEYLLVQMVCELGHQIGSDRLRADLAWLAEQGLVTVRDTAGVQIATLSRRGADVALGRVQVPGVKRPLPA